jgi:hypothetical protein
MSVGIYPSAVVERAMKVEEVLLADHPPRISTLTSCNADYGFLFRRL